MEAHRAFAVAHHDRWRPQAPDPQRRPPRPFATAALRSDLRRRERSDVATEPSVRYLEVPARRLVLYREPERPREVNP